MHDEDQSGGDRRSRELLKKDDDLLSGIEQLYQAISRLMRIFETANEQMLSEYESEERSIQEQIGELLEQNTKIARGIITLAERFDRLEHRVSEQLDTKGSRSPNEDPYTGLRAGGELAENDQLPFSPHQQTPFIHDPEPDKRLPDENEPPRPS